MAKDFEISQVAKGNGTYIDIRGKEDGKFTAFLADVVDNVRQPTRMGFLDLVKTANPFMTIRAPIREVGTDGQFLTRPRQKDGKFIDAKGKPVETEAEAGREYVYKTQKDDSSKLVYGQVAVINVKNTKLGGEPTAMTLFNTKVYSDDEALKCERVYFKMSQLDQETDAGKAEHAALKATLNDMRKDLGEWRTFFLGKGADTLREMGFEIREREKNDGPSPT